MIGVRCGSGTAGYPSPDLRPRQSAPIGPSASFRREPLPHGHGLGTPVRGDAGRFEGRGHARRVEGELPRQHVVEHLPPLPERGLDQPPQLVLLLGGESIVRVIRLDAR